MRLLVLSAIFVLVAGASVPAQDAADEAALRAEALRLVNDDRARNGLPPLVLGEALNTAAAAHAADMLQQNYYAHVSPEGEDVQDRYGDAGGSRWELVAENISRCVGCQPTPVTVRSLQQGWMESPEHRHNILARGIERFGFGLAAGEAGTLYAVQTFAGPGMPRGLEEGEAPEPVSGDEAVHVFLEQINTARTEAGVSALAASEQLTAAANALLPAPEQADFAVGSGNIYEALPASDRERWRLLSTASGACGGCGRVPARSDVAAFAEDWLGDAGIRSSLLADDGSHLGFGIVANGEGKKVAVAVIGAER